MDRDGVAGVRAAQVVLPCTDLHATLAFFTTLGFRVDAVHPADDPSVAVVSGHGLQVRLERGLDAGPGRLRLLCTDPSAVAGGATELTAPNGTHIELVPASPPVALPPWRPSFVLSRMQSGAAWVEGRAGMRYRDLVPGRQGGRLIASHIEIPRGGPVPDYVHYHRVAFQMIYCAKGWVRVVYEDQGAPFVLRAGDCALQPPEIRHRVLECSPGLEVIEVGSPAEHETFADHDLVLPSAALNPDREFGGQRFVRHEAAAATWAPWRVDGVEARDLGIAAATKRVAGAWVLRASGDRTARASSHPAEMLFGYVLRGHATIRREDGPSDGIGEGDAFVIPAGLRYAIEDASGDLERLVVLLPA
ncbi:MAG TPA: cupin domain-containing protein [Polyangiaceae bacterium]